MLTLIYLTYTAIRALRGLTTTYADPVKVLLLILLVYIDLSIFIYLKEHYGQTL